MKPHEILQQIIDNGGSCNWLRYSDWEACDICPLGKSGCCCDYVDNICQDISNDSFAKVASKILNQLESQRILLGDERDA